MIARPRIVVSKRSLLGMGIALLLIGIVGNVLARGAAWNDYSYLHVLGKMLLAGEDPYVHDMRLTYIRRYTDHADMELQPYLPASAMVLFPLMFLPLGVASWLFFWLSLGVLMTGLWRMLRVFGAGLDTSACALILGLAASSIAVRSNIYGLQTGTLTTGLLCLYMTALQRQRTGEALFYGTIGLCLKITNALPFVALALLQRRLKLAAGMLGLFVVINGAGFARAGGATAFRNYSANIAQVERPDRIDSVDPRTPASLTRLDWMYLMTGCGLPPVGARSLGVALGATALLILLWEGARLHAHARENWTLLAFLAPIVCLNILIVYHHYYESVLLVPVVIGAYLSASCASGIRALIWFAVPLGVYFGFTPRVIFERYAEAHGSLFLLVAARLVGAGLLFLLFPVTLWALHQVINKHLQARSA